MQISFEVLDFNTLEDTIEMLGRKGFMFYKNFGWHPNLFPYTEALKHEYHVAGMYLVINNDKTFLFRYYLLPGLYNPLRLYKNPQTFDDVIILN